MTFTVVNVDKLSGAIPDQFAIIVMVLLSRPPKNALRLCASPSASAAHVARVKIKIGRSVVWTRHGSIYDPTLHLTHPTDVPRTDYRTKTR
jgi:hypothetical protein